jgi:Protein of unknown function (DUF3237)
MHLTNDGLSLWYGTPDAPAPGDEGVVERRGVPLVVGVSPPNPSNTVAVRYRTDRGLVRTLTGREIRTDHQRGAQYFAFTFPPFVTGNLVEFAPVFRCGGRQTPPPHLADRFPSKFHLAAAEPVAAAQALKPARVPQQGGTAGHGFQPAIDFVAYVAVQFERTQYVGDTPAGMRVNFFVREGVLEGKGLQGKVAEHSSDHLIVRRDGIGEVHIRAVFTTSDGAVLDVESGGYADFGPEGYERALAHALPDRAPLVVTPLITTRHPKYRWLSRVQCVGVGYTHLDAGQASYDVYAASVRAMK